MVPIVWGNTQVSDFFFFGAEKVCPMQEQETWAECLQIFWLHLSPFYLPVTNMKIYFLISKAWSWVRSLICMSLIWQSNPLYMLTYLYLFLHFYKSYPLLSKWIFSLPLKFKYYNQVFKILESHFIHIALFFVRLFDLEILV